MQMYKGLGRVGLIAFIIGLFLLPLYLKRLTSRLIRR